MTKIILLLLGSGALILLVSHYFPWPRLTPDYALDWSFIQDVGGLKLGDPVKVKADTWQIPVICDVSGLTSVTRKPVTLNSTLVVENVLYRIVGPDIFIRVAVNSVPSSSARDAKCPPLQLQGITEGRYNIYYDDKAGQVRVGEVFLQ